MGHDNNKSNRMYYRTVSALYAFGRFLSGGRAGRAGEGERRGAVFAIDSIGDHIIDLYFYQAVTKESDAYDGWCAAGIYRAVRDPEWKKMVFCSEKHTDTQTGRIACRFGSVDRATDSDAWDWYTHG